MTAEELREYVKAHPGKLGKATVSMLLRAANEIERLTPPPKDAA